MTNLHRIIAPIISAALLLISTGSSSAEIDINRALADPGLNPGRTSIYVADATNGTVLASHQPDMALNPASCAKILTSVTALALLGPDYRFQTQFWTDRKLGRGEIGTLYVYGTGDPWLVTEELWRMAANLRAKGITRVSNGIAVDNSYFDSFEVPRKSGNEGRAYTAKTAAVAVNFNSIGVQVGPGKRPGSPAAIELDPPIDGYRIINRVVTRPKGIVTIQMPSGSDEIIVSGRVPAGVGPQVYWHSVPDPVHFAGEVIKYALVQNGISVDGPVRSEMVPGNAISLSTEESKPLIEILSDMNKHSNNFIAEQILKHLGAERLGAPGSTAKGVEVLKEYLASLGIRDGFDLENGSGLSERTRVSAEQLVKVLVAVYRDKKLRDRFMSTLSILGVDGTMKGWSRFAPELQGIVYAKTGTINGVSTLAGYVTMRNGHMAAFAILANQVPKGAWGAHQAQLTLVRAIAETSR